ncbi:P-loop containing nucleoside triphosphate hydrolase protein [Neolentinus lepideus HHB14362 ss-1]|uniref:p-loop containing nucleoside triphosphate hydrolase protein n=1 Tax=Neolentinus lepideus HHB14362 ss-1 TaxID=1314782 RepID=A0A165R1J9_9AGAM|nr:P-loop containing nucleoside triphosphate hydrolase protein [Neolentinus lepideus HHB14362 ss-1]
MRIHTGVGLAFILFALQASKSIFIQSSTSIMRELQLNMQSAVIIGAYQKSFRLDNQEAANHPVGNVMNVINVDSERIGIAIENMQQFWGLIVQLIVSVVLLSGYLGRAIWAGIGSMIVIIFIQTVITPFMYNLTGTEMEVVDKRLGLTREMLQGIKIIKLRALEPYVLSLISSVRSKQLKFVRLENFFSIGLFSASQCSAVLLPLFTFIVYSSLRDGLDATVVFPALTLFSQLLEPLNFLPQLVSSFIQAKVSWDRTCKLFQARETSEIEDPGFLNLLFKSRQKSKSDVNSVEVNESVLKDISLRVPVGGFVVVLGGVGSGKTSLLSAIAGQLELVSGLVSHQGTIAYLTQKPWLLTQTIEGNILFGLPMDHARFNAVLRVCELTDDLAQLPHGAKSQVAEGAANLSGGQQARIALARALYSDSDIYLLDDTFSALDARVSARVFKATIQYLKSKTVLLITHDVKLADGADQVYVVSNGSIVENGQPTEILASLNEAKLHDIANVGHNIHKIEQSNEESIELSNADDEDDEDEIVVTEGRRKGHVSWPTYLRYIRATGGFTTVVVLLVILVVQQTAVVISNLWLYWWDDNSFHISNQKYLLAYGLIGVAVFLLSLALGNMSVVTATYRACIIYHQLALDKVAHAPLHFFETNPVGRIMNRFSKDVNGVDHELYVWVFNVVTGVFIIAGLVIVMCWPSPYLAITVPVLGLIYYLIYAFYRGANIELKRLTSKNRSPLYAYVSETLEGAIVLKSFNRVESAHETALQLLDFSNRPFYISRSAELWLLLRIELFASLVTLAMVLISSATSASGSLVGLALSSAFALTNEVNALIRSTAEVESNMNAVERLDEYCYDLPSEGALTPALRDIPPSWPSAGAILINNMIVKYPSRPDVAALEISSLDIRSGENIGIVGRTGSGKSTLLSAMLRLVEYGGMVQIDGIDIRGLPVQKLRSSIACVSQDSGLFSGTLRSNLDPLGQATDAALLSMLALVGLESFDLNMELTAGGKNLSQGHRQLVIVAAALLGEPKVVILDEATASLDNAASANITNLVRENLAHATILTIAHRLETVMDCDRIVVLNKGEIAEVGSPSELLSKQDGLFAQMVNATQQQDGDL